MQVQTCRCIGAEVQRCSQWCRGAVRGVGCRGAELQRGTEVFRFRGVQRCSEVKRCRCRCMCRCKGRGAVEEVQKCAAVCTHCAEVQRCSRDADAEVQRFPQQLQTYSR